MFVQTEITPNPNSIKFLPGKIVSNSGSFEVKVPSGFSLQAGTSPIALYTIYHLSTTAAVVGNVW